MEELLLENFLSELTELSKRHNIEIGGCGCCGSPYLITLNGEFRDLGGNLEFDEELQKYIISK